MALYQLILAYDGTDFSGFQRQGRARTVQGVIELVLQEFGWKERAILFAGRTDAGVHAVGQVVTFSLDWQHSSADLQSALNAKLPADISVLDIAKAEAEFHPRYDASSRTYRYTIYQLPSRQPLMERFAWRIWPELDENLLNECAKVFIGEHDFSSFGRAMKPGSSTIREVKLSHWQCIENLLQYEIESNAFLYHMVRRLVYCQIQVAKRKMTLQEVEEGLRSKTKVRPGLAPANGLLLYSVKYDGTRRGNVVEDEN